MNVSPNELREFGLKCFEAYGVPRDQAEVVIDHLITASLRGVDSHGIIRLLYYLDGIEKGYVKPVAKITVLKETPVMARDPIPNGAEILNSYNDIVYN